MMHTVVANFFGGPGLGKSTTVHGLMYELKRRGIKVEIASEYAKDLVYDEDWAGLADQRSIAVEQERRVRRFVGKVDLVLNEAPFLHAFVYGPDPVDERFSEEIRAAWARYDNVNFLIHRSPAFAYDPIGRYQDAFKARLVDEKVHAMLLAEGVTFTSVAAEGAVATLLEVMLSEEHFPHWKNTASDDGHERLPNVM